MGFIVAVDGTAGSGKGSVTKIVAERLNLVTIDTGAMYRSVALAMLEQKIGLEDTEKIAKILKDIKIEFVDEGTEKKVFLNGKKLIIKTSQNTNFLRFLFPFSRFLLVVLI